MLETELKSLIDYETFIKIKDNYKWDKVITQENHYYTDTKGELQKNRATFRIRVADGKPRLQIKIHKNSDSPLQVCEELEFPIDSIPESFDSESVKKYTGLNTGKLVRLGSNVTERYSLMWNDSTEICLDRSTYLDMTDYEIEVEYSGECPSALTEELKTLGVSFIQNSVGKYTRFIKRFREVFMQE